MKHVFCVIVASLWLTMSGQYFPVEAVFVVTDKNSYAIDDTMRIEGKMLRVDCDSVSKSYSRYAYLEVVDGNDSIVSRSKVSCDMKGEFIAFLPVDMLWGEGDFYLRAYTKFMTNYHESTFPVNRFVVNNQGVVKRGSDGIVCRFYPEGATHLISGTYQNVGVKTLDYYGSPISAKVSFANGAGEVVTDVSTSANGWQIAKLMPQLGETYYATVDYDGEQRTFELPVVKSGLGLQIKVRNGQLVCRVNHSEDVEVSRKYKFCIVHPSIGLQVMDVDRDVSLFGLDDVSSGLISVFMLGDDNRIVSEASTWYSGNTQSLQVKGFDASSGVVRFDQPLDSLSSVYCRFVDADEVFTNAVGQLCYESNLSSPEPFPYAIHCDGSDGWHSDIDAWLYSATYSRMDVEKTLREGVNMSVLPEHELHIRGVVSSKVLGPLSKGTVVGYQTGNHNTFTTTIDRRGGFDLSVYDFPQGERFFVEAYDRLEKPGTYEYDFANDSLPSVTIKNRCGFGMGRDSRDVSTAKRSLTGVNQLPDVVIKARVSQERPKNESKVFYKSKYVSEETMESRHFQTFEQLVGYFFSYIRLLRKPRPSENAEGAERAGRANSVSQTTNDDMNDDGGTYILLNWRRGDEVKIQIDGMPVTIDQAMYWNIDDVATAEYLSPNEALPYASLAGGGLLRLTTKHPKNEKALSLGVFYIPELGIANYNMQREDYPVEVRKDKSRVLVDVISPKYGVRSFALSLGE